MIIGLTGGIGSGKSTIAKQLRQMGYEVYDTDSEAKRLIVEDPYVREQIIILFGPEAYQGGVYQTQFVAQQVFADKELLSQLNAIVHPAVRRDILSRLADSMILDGRSNSEQFVDNSQQSFFFIECAILYTAHLDDICDKVVAVIAPEAVRLERVIERDHSDVTKVLARMRIQDVEMDLKRADIIINNDGNAPISVLCEEIITQI
jgi:dephospho-CoA kinase